MIQTDWKEQLSYTLDDIHWMQSGSSAKECLIAYVGNFLLLSPVVGTMLLRDDEYWVWEVRKYAGRTTHFGAHRQKNQTQDVIERYLMELA